MIKDSMFVFGLPQFAGINFIFDNYNLDHVTKALILSELPPLFKKYGIKLETNDIQNYVNNMYNLTKERTFKKEIDFLEEIEKMSYVKDTKKVVYLKLSKDLYEFYQKIFKFDSEDKLIEKLIYDRYDYYFNKYDKNAYKKFMEFLNKNISQNGFFDVDVTTDEDLEMCKENWIDKKEQRIRTFFHKLKEIYPNTPVVFQSIRFYHVYLFLKNKYPEITIEDAVLDEIDLSISKRLKAVYVNDIYGDKQYKNSFNHYVVLLPFQIKNIICNSKSLVNHFFELDKEQLKQIYKEHYNSKRKITYRNAENFEEIIDYLEYERRVLKKDDVFLTSIDGLPEMFIPYFSFCLKHYEQISYFKSRLNEISDKNKIIEEMINEFGKENVFDLLTQLLLDNELINHELISNNEIDVEKRKVKDIRKWRKIYENNCTKR